MKNLASFCVREVKRIAAEKKKEMSILLQKENESRSKRQSHINELSENLREGNVRCGGRAEEEGHLVELVSN